MSMVLTAGEEIIANTMKDRRVNTAKNMAVNGWVHGRERRDSVLRNARSVIESLKKKSVSDRIMDSMLVKGEVKPKREKKDVSVVDIGHRFITIATAASIVMGVLFVSEQVTSIIDSAHASVALGKHIR